VNSTSSAGGAARKDQIGPRALFAQRLGDVAAATEALLARILTTEAAAGEIHRPRRLIEAMRYATLGSGKRFRPLLVVESAALFDVPRENALMTAAAVECVHCYSLVHDDLPAMDNDVLRRGRPTAHKRFDEATAILAGDALLTIAFDILARPETCADPKTRIALVGELARAAGVGGMAGGQMLDLAAEDRFPDTSRPARESDIALLQSMKTGALIRLASCAGAILADVHDGRRAALQRYGSALGQGFQIADDLLDLQSDAAALGKSTGKDEAAGKATMARLLGEAQARERLAALVAEARAALAPFGERAAVLAAAATFVAEREA
jgi:farnesyl diphosphate synthase